MPPTAQGPVSYSLPHVYTLLSPAGTFPSSFIYAKASLMFISKEANKTLSPGQHSISLLPYQIAFVSSFHFLLKSGSVLCPHLYHHWSTKITLSIFPPKLYCLLYNEIQWTILRSYLQGLWASLDSADYLLLLEALSRLCNWLFLLLLLRWSSPVPRGLVLSSYSTLMSSILVGYYFISMIAKYICH